MKNEHYIYPAIFDYQDEGITVTFPDIPGCITEGNTDEEALSNAKEVLELCLIGDEADENPFPKASSLNSIILEPSQRAVLIEAYLDIARERVKMRYIKKTITLPAWINLKAEQCGINFSQTLQEAIKERLGLAGK
jgi:predicted RNase H-like HicB family nuclease